MTPLALVLIMAGVVCAFTWISSLVTKDHSWVDRLWSIVPVAYVWVFAAFAGLSDARLNVMAVLVTLWGARLTFNFARKGGYTGTEDYRWPILRARMKRWQFEIFNLFFIVLYQNAILVLITLPALTAYENRDTPFGMLDVAVTALFLLFLIGETVADQQQWNFHQAKKAGGPGFSPRFLQTGLWKYSRHPNFFFEQAQWWAIFLFGAIAAGSLLQWTVLGAALLTGLFIGSTIFTESITKSRYPEYADYQATTSSIVPPASTASTAPGHGIVGVARAPQSVERLTYPHVVHPLQHPAQRAQLKAMAPAMLTAEEAAALHPAPPMTESKIARLRLLAADSNPRIRERAALDYHLPEDVFEVLARDPDPEVRACVARNESTPCDILRSLVADPSERVRGFLAVNFFVPLDAMERLAEDSSPVVRELVRWKAELATA